MVYSSCPSSNPGLAFKISAVIKTFKNKTSNDTAKPIYFFLYKLNKKTINKNSSYYLSVLSY